MAYVKIGGLKFQLREVKSMYADEDKELKLDGDINYTRQMIRVEKDLCQSTKDMVLVHEIVHGLLTTAISRELGGDEQLVLSLGHGLYALLRDNPKLFTEIVNRK